MKLFWLYCSIFLAGCSISSKTIYQDELVRTERSESVVDGSRRYQAATTVDGTALKIGLSQEELCETRETPILHRHAHIERVASPSPLAYILPGIGLLGLGAAVAFGGDYVSLAAGLGPQPPIAYQIAGGLVGTGGLSLVVIGAVHGLRAVDSHKDLGLVAGTPVSRRFSCNAGPVRALPVALRLGQGNEVASVSDDLGAVRLSFADTPIQDVPRLGNRVSIRIKKALFNLDLPDADVEQLRRTLEEDPTTRASKDLLTQRQAECARLTGIAEAVAIDGNSAEELETEARTAWENARSECRDLWTPETQGKYSTALQQIAKNAAARKERRCSDALQAAEAIHHSSDVDDEIARAQAACRDVPSASSRLAKAQKRIAQLEEQEERAARAAKQAEAQKAKLRLAKLKQREAAAQEKEASKRLMCCDGTVSPSCTCYGSHRNCCVDHGGVCGCE
ncbi:MAG: hypothetical protein U1A78_39215 [Polyangia bacterium]